MTIAHERSRASDARSHVGRSRFDFVLSLSPPPRSSNGRPVLDDSVPEFFTAQAFDMLLLHGHRTIMRDLNVSACRRPRKLTQDF